MREDLQGGRVYLPRRPSTSSSCELKLRQDGTLDPQGGRLAAVIRYEAERAESLYAEGLALLPLLDWRSRGCCGALSGIYHELLKVIAAKPEADLRPAALAAGEDEAGGGGARAAAAAVRPAARPMKRDTDGQWPAAVNGSGGVGRSGRGAGGAARARGRRRARRDHARR